MFAFTSISEGQCLAALEILARGRPVVATPVGAFPEFLSDGLLGTLAAPDQPEEFARSLVTVARQIRENTFTPNGVQAAYRKRFPREQVIQGYVDLISECERPE
jgi:glycosyltransferase involved in cell wall biosynthesis